MEELSNGGSAPGDATASASTQPCASCSRSSSGDSGRTMRRTSASCSSTVFTRAPLSCPAGASDRCDRGVLSDELLQPGKEIRAEVLAFDGESDDRPEVVRAVDGVVAPAAEDDAVHRLTRVAGGGEVAHRVGELDLATTARRH